MYIMSVICELRLVRISRIGHHQQISRAHFPNFSKISVELFLCPIMFVAMVPSISLPISPATPSPRILVSTMMVRVEILLVIYASFAGPKMYNAMSSFESPGSKGSTRIHMDMADAVNIMTYASPLPDGKPGCAVWDLFRAEDAKGLRNFLKKKFKGTFQHDPIHSQQFYLDSQLRKELYETQGIKSHRVYQKPGQAIFIPAGCAHQVRRLPMGCSTMLTFCNAGMQPCGLYQSCNRFR